MKTFRISAVVLSILLVSSLSQGCSKSEYKQEKGLFNIKFGADDYFAADPESVGGVTFLENNDLAMERANDRYDVKKRMIGRDAVTEGANIHTAPGSSVRFAADFKNNYFQVKVKKDSRLHFRNTESGWVYLSGEGSFRDKETKKKYKLGAKRNVKWFRKSFKSDDPVARERAFYELEWYPRIFRKKDIRQSVRDALKSDQRFVKAAASYTLRELGDQDDLAVVKEAVLGEKDPFVEYAFKDALFSIQKRKK